MKVTVKIDNRVFEVEIGDLRERPIRAVVDGDEFEVWPEESHSEEHLGEAAVPFIAEALAGEQSTTGERGRTVTAPIPGVILEVRVKEGQSVSLGQELCWIEAMKMKSPIRAHRSGTLQRIHVSAGDHVNHNQILMEYTD